MWNTYRYNDMLAPYINFIKLTTNIGVLFCYYIWLSQWHVSQKPPVTLPWKLQTRNTHSQIFATYTNQTGNIHEDKFTSNRIILLYLHTTSNTHNFHRLHVRIEEFDSRIRRELPKWRNEDPLTTAWPGTQDPVISTDLIWFARPNPLFSLHYIPSHYI